jgi:hypothetical protein
LSKGRENISLSKERTFMKQMKRSKGPVAQPIIRRKNLLRRKRSEGSRFKASLGK